MKDQHNIKTVTMMIPAEDIKSGSYQRSKLVPESEVARRASEFDWSAFGHIVVADRLGLKDYYVVDGATRLRVLAKAGIGGKVPCAVFKSTGEAHEAAVFRRINKSRTHVSAIDSFMSGVIAGEPTETAIMETISRMGFTVTTHARNQDEIDFVTTLMRAWVVDRVAVRDALFTGRKITDPEAMHNITFKGLWYLAHDGVDIEKCSDAIIKRGGQARIEQSARTVAIEAGHNNVNPRTAAIGILRLVNHRRSQRNRITIRNMDV